MNFIINSPKHGKRKIIIDNEDWGKVKEHNWQVAKICGMYYVVTMIYIRDKINTGIKRRTLRLHRLIMNVTDPKIVVDHKDHNTFDNRKSNLRICTQKYNSFNSKKTSNKKSSKYKGVDFFKSKDKFRARIKVGDKTYSLGYFKDEIKAAQAYNNAAIEHHGEFACLNKL